MMDRKFFPGLYMTLLFVAISCNAIAQTKVNWITWEQAEALSKTEPRKVLVDVYTEWCGWCKKMDKSTFQNEEIANYLNANYYAIKFNAEQKDDITLKGKNYEYVRNMGGKGYHELAMKITFGKLQYPTLVFLDEKLDVIQPLAGFKDAETFEMIMTYYGEDHHKTTPWNKYKASFSNK